MIQPVTVGAFNYLRRNLSKETELAKTDTPPWAELVEVHAYEHASRGLGLPKSTLTNTSPVG